MTLEIDKMLVLSTAHLREKTCNEWLPKAGTHHAVTVYPKGEYGWFIWCGDTEHGFQFEKPGADAPAVPNELLAAMAFAAEHGCNWISFDRDADQVAELVVFDW